ncbi:MAG: hypothetical protein UV74_C0013G0256 [Candidatus Woesebacteria bacterium GW2011_GWB1_43_14]|uniref:Uncharacterized protein n=1 Tax=Candidatus Woesebacteria bacterium GW2011_GWB1_43_14 TaxID=1618578 RepID=A0A0G1DHI0_9BACT|nr:MAG: hypothetical protein UT21_C0002G0037 [Candidatus Woesebacteria bacterium GW2011_GWA1_39_11b]KKS78450.1 MAG: hypothetical protein UV51_C0001G0166 [Candidatus Woesebacteria bacterium GW2011_GWC1_42_9]KKS97134.1 MAG: hypothetical protein UV74_C0013G0256 [Candidatus Woesebacteria bacterium GW2011_GWB1_43_14]
MLDMIIAIGIANGISIFIRIEGDIVIIGIYDSQICRQITCQIRTVKELVVASNGLLEEVGVISLS